MKIEHYIEQTATKLKDDLTKLIGTIFKSED